MPGLGHSPPGVFDPGTARAALGQDDVDALVLSLQGIKWGKTSDQAARTLQDEMGVGSEALWDWAVRLASRPEPQARGTAAPVFQHYWQSRPGSVHSILLRLSDDEDWWVREMAHVAMGDLLLAHYGQVYPLLVTWATHRSPNVRRAVTLAARNVAIHGRPEWADPLLDLIEPLLADRTEYVRKNLGPYALGDGLLRCHGQVTFTRLPSWAHDPREAVRWNVAMAFRSSGGTKHVREAVPILTRLAADDRRFVWRAAAAALQYLGRRQPDVVRPLLEAWLEDDQRRRTASVALRYMPTADNHT